jgi:hypothetical protein
MKARLKLDVAWAMSEHDRSQPSRENELTLSISEAVGD